MESVMADAAPAPEVAEAGIDEAVLTAANDQGPSSEVAPAEEAVAEETAVEPEAEPQAETEAEVQTAEPEEPARKSSRHRIHGTPETEAATDTSEAGEDETEESKSRSKRGWWQRRSFF